MQRWLPTNRQYCHAKLNLGRLTSDNLNKASPIGGAFLFV